MAQTRNIPIDSAGFIGLIDGGGKRHSEWLSADAIDLYSLSPHYLYIRKQKWGICDTNLVEVWSSEYDNITRQNGMIYTLTGTQFKLWTAALENVAEFEGVLSVVHESRRSYNAEHSPVTILRTKKGYGLINQSGKWLLAPQYDNAFFMDGIVYLRSGNLFGFYAPFSNQLVLPQWSTIGLFNEFIIEVQDNAGQRTYFMNDGTRVPDSDSTLVVDNQVGMIKVYQKGKGELYDFELNRVLHYKGEDIFPSHRPLYWTVENKRYKNQEFAVKRNGKIGLINQTGSVILPFKYEHITWLFKNYYRVMVNGKFGVVDAKGREIIPPIYTFIGRNSGYFEVYLYGKKGIIDEKGITIVPVEFEDLRFLSGGVVTKQATGCGFYTLDGTAVLPATFKVYTGPDGPEFESNNGIAMVGKHGLLTPLNCSSISKSKTKIKYYVGNEVFIHRLKDDRLVDTTVYSLKRSIKQLVKRERRLYHFAYHKHEVFQNQLTGKIGAVRKIEDGFSIQARYYNVIRGAGQLVSVPANDTVPLAGTSIYTKALLVEFMPNIGRLGRQLYADVKPGRRERWTKSEFTVVLTANRKWKFKSSNVNLSDGVEVPFIQFQSDGYSKILHEGELNLIEGHDLMGFRKLYEHMNRGYNLVIKNAKLFDLLANNTMVKVKDPIWEVFKKQTDYTYVRLGRFSYFKKVPKGKAIVKVPHSGYGVVDHKGEYIIQPNAQRVDCIERNGKTYFISSLERVGLDGVSESVIELYDTKQKLLESNRLVSVVAPGFFKIDRFGQYALVDTSLNAIYYYH